MHYTKTSSVSFYLVMFNKEKKNNSFFSKQFYLKWFWLQVPDGGKVEFVYLVITFCLKYLLYTVIDNCKKTTSILKQYSSN